MNSGNLSVNLPKFDAIKWFSRFSGKSKRIKPSQLQPVLEFALLWSLFERKVCGCNANMNKIEVHVKSLMQSDAKKIEKYEPYLHYFRIRYSGCIQMNDLAECLIPNRNQRTRNSENIKLVYKVLNSEVSAKSEVVIALLFIAYRIRNNLFHGEKNIYVLESDDSLFNAINLLLAEYLSDFNATN